MRLCVAVRPFIAVRYLHLYSTSIYLILLIESNISFCHSQLSLLILRIYFSSFLLAFSLCIFLLFLFLFFLCIIRLLKRIIVTVNYCGDQSHGYDIFKPHMSSSGTLGTGGGGGGGDGMARTVSQNGMSSSNTDRFSNSLS